MSIKRTYKLNEKSIPVFSIDVVVDGSRHKYRDHRPERLALAIEVVCGYGVQFRLVGVTLQLLSGIGATVELGSHLAKIP